MRTACRGCEQRRALVPGSRGGQKEKENGRHSVDVAVRVADADLGRRCRPTREAHACHAAGHMARDHDNPHGHDARNWETPGKPIHHMDSI